MDFTVEEMNLMCIYSTTDKMTLLAQIKESLPDVYDPDMHTLMNDVIRKLEGMADEDFAALAFWADYED